MNLSEYKKHGYTILPDMISKEDLETCRNYGIRLRYWVNNRIGQPCAFGPPRHWQGVACAGMYYPELFSVYTSPRMHSIASWILETEPYLFNDQMVYKLPSDSFEFQSHYDNQYGPNKSGKIHTVNCSIILDDFTEANGALSLKSQFTKKWETIYPKAGSIVCINGNTYHHSEQNVSNFPRGLYACVYTESPIVLDNFYTDKFEV